MCLEVVATLGSNSLFFTFLETFIKFGGGSLLILLESFLVGSTLFLLLKKTDLTLKFGCVFPFSLKDNSNFGYFHLEVSLDLKKLTVTLLECSPVSSLLALISSFEAKEDRLLHLESLGNIFSNTFSALSTLLCLSSSLLYLDCKKLMDSLSLILSLKSYLKPTSDLIA